MRDSIEAGPSFFTVLASRRSVRGYLPEEVPLQTLESIFSAAQQAPSWCNIQPWRVWVTRGAQTRALVDALMTAATTGAPTPDFPWPPEYPEPYGKHRRECGAALYSAMGVARDDRAGRQEAWMRNFRAFDAPHLAMVAIDRRFNHYAMLDLGCWLQSVLLGAQALGVATCPEASLATFPDAARAVLGIPDELGLVMGIAMGYEDPSVAANRCRTTRSALEANVRFVG
ncbi:MAG: nitroreductase [Myxococcaceae bacterium]|nr:MAG: nitroreductase [Myxococcaceae bacterium]